MSRTASLLVFYIVLLGALCGQETAKAFFINSSLKRYFVRSPCYDPEDACTEPYITNGAKTSCHKGAKDKVSLFYKLLVLYPREIFICFSLINYSLLRVYLLVHPIQ